MQRPRFCSNERKVSENKLITEQHSDKMWRKQFLGVQLRAGCHILSVLIKTILLIQCCDISFIQKANAIDAMWKHCLHGTCFRTLGPFESYTEIEEKCLSFGGKLFSASDHLTMTHVQEVFENATKDATSPILFVGGLINHDVPGGLSFDDGAETNETFVNEMLRNTSTLEISEGSCLRSKRISDDLSDIAWFVESCSPQSAAYSVCKHDSPEYGFCYEVRWQDEQDRPRKKVLEPVTKFPLGHPKLSRKVCGGADIAYIPPTGLWSKAGATDESADTCKSITGGELFYAYGYPEYSSSNTGYSTDNALSMFFVVDTEYRGYLVLTIDKPHGVDSDSGYLGLEINSTGMETSDVIVELHDDPAMVISGDECTENDVKGKTYSKDCYAWNGSNGSFIWRWHPCCTDGMVLGRLPSSEFGLSLEIVKKIGLSKMLLGNFIPDESDIELLEIPFSSSLTVSGYECPAFCSAINNCGECSNTEGCGWCPETGCEATGAKGGCSSGWLDMDSDGCCEDCANSTSCDDCVAIDGCGWNWKDRTCKSGNSYSRRMCKTSTFLEDYFAFSASECTTKAPTISQSTTESPTISPSITPAPSTSSITDFYSLTDASSNTPSNAPSDAPSDAPSRGRSLEPTFHPTLTPSEGTTSWTSSPTQVPIDNRDDSDDDDTEYTPNNTDIGTDQYDASLPLSSDGENKKTWILPLVGSLGGLLALGILLLAGRAFKQRWGRHGGGAAEKVFAAGIGGPTLTVSSVANVYKQSNPMFDHLSLADSESIELPKRRRYPKNDLICALLAQKEEDLQFRLYTNNPAIAMRLSKESKCFVKCTEDDGDILDSMERSGAFGTLMDLATSGRTKLSNSRVKTHLRIKKRDEWTRHVDPASQSEFYYNGKLNEVIHNKAGIREAASSAKSDEVDPLRWEFAPDEFDDFEKVIDVLAGANWILKKDLHLDYYSNPETKERMWIENT